jgi:hypothetical protein
VCTAGGEGLEFHMGQPNIFEQIEAIIDNRDTMM